MAATRKPKPTAATADDDALAALAADAEPTTDDVKDDTPVDAPHVAEGENPASGTSDDRDPGEVALAERHGDPEPAPDVVVDEEWRAEDQLNDTSFEPYLDDAGNWVTPELVAYENQAWLAQVQAYDRATGTGPAPDVAPKDPDPQTIDDAYPVPPLDGGPVAPEGA